MYINHIKQYSHWQCGHFPQWNMMDEASLAKYLSVIGVMCLSFESSSRNFPAVLNTCAALHQTAAQFTLLHSVLDRTGNKYCCYSL